ncbi:MAG: ABC transporter ATP-binding protein [Anaerolineae bacterium]|nr:ABC transporter ATP-binding protein [Anaerolineae bacterium]
MSQLLVDVQDISKKFCRDLKRSLLYGVRDVWTEIRGGSVSPALRSKEFWALQDVSFQLRRGESLGIIGRNGAGKTTLLKILNGLIKPTRGSVTMRGRVQALIALNAGISPVLTGRENIYINGTMMGLSRHDIQQRLDAIVDFAEIGDFLDTPMRNYSSGMRVRLGFAVAIHVRPDVLIIDEVLAVGDQKFRRKARNAMAQLLEQEIALIFISHNLHEVMGITQQALWLDGGQVVQRGDSSAVCNAYLQSSLGGSVSQTGDIPPLQPGNKRTGELIVQEVQTQVNGVTGGRAVTVSSGTCLQFELTLHAQATIAEAVYHVFELHDLNGSNAGCVVINDHIQAVAGDRLTRRFEVTTGDLFAGDYVVAYQIATEGGPEFENISNLLYASVTAPDLTELVIPGTVNHLRPLNNSRGAWRIPFTMQPPTAARPASEEKSR